MPSILFASHHCFVDFASGAAVAARDLFILLSQRGWETRAVCGSMLDAEKPGFDKLMESHGAGGQRREGNAAGVSFTTHELVDEGIGVKVYHPGKWSSPVAIEQGYPYLQMLDAEVAERRPDVLLAFGGGWMGRGVMAVARRHGVPAVFWLRNTQYTAADLFASAAGAIVPSEYTAQYYKNKLKLDCAAISSPIRPERILIAERKPRFATFFSPCPNKGVFYFARIASELGRLRPDIPVLVALGRGDLGWLSQTGLNLRQLPNLKVITPTSDPRQIYQMTRVILAPSLWQETFLRVAAEGAFNGIPTLASRRGGIEETLGDSGFVFDIPAHHTPEFRRVPSVPEVGPWIDVIQRIFDDAKFEAEQRKKSLRRSEYFRPERVGAAHEEYLLDAIKRGAAARPSKPLAEDMAFAQSFFKEPIALERFG